MGHISEEKEEEKNIKAKKQNWTSNAVRDVKEELCENRFERFRVTREAGRQKNEMNRKKDPLCRGQLWSWNDAWKNIILSLVSAQFVMSYTRSLSRLENVSQDVAKYFVILRATLRSDKSKQMTQSKHLKTCRIQLNTQKSFQVCLLFFFGKNSPPFVSVRSAQLTYVRLQIDHCWTSPRDDFAHK